MGYNWNSIITYFKNVLDSTYVKTNDSRLTDNRTPTSHTHGNLQNDGAVGSSNNESKNVVTDSNGKITVEDKPSIPSASNTTPSMDTLNGDVGNGVTWARSNHKHPKSDLYAEASHTHSATDVTDSNSGNYSNIGNLNSNSSQQVINNAINSKLGSLTVDVIEWDTADNDGFPSTTASSSTMNKLYLIKNTIEEEYFYFEDDKIKGENLKDDITYVLAYDNSQNYDTSNNQDDDYYCYITSVMSKVYNDSTFNVDSSLYNNYPLRIYSTTMSPSMMNQRPTDSVYEIKNMINNDNYYSFDYLGEINVSESKTEFTVTTDSNDTDAYDVFVTKRTGTSGDYSYNWELIDSVSLDVSGKADISSLSNVAFSGDYDDLTDKPTIPVDVSDLTDTQNTAFTPKTHTHNEYLTKTTADTYYQAIGSSSAITSSDLTDVETVEVVVTYTDNSTETLVLLAQTQAQGNGE